MVKSHILSHNFEKIYYTAFNFLISDKSNDTKIIKNGRKCEKLEKKYSRVPSWNFFEFFDVLKILILFALLTIFDNFGIICFKVCQVYLHYLLFIYWPSSIPIVGRSKPACIETYSNFLILPSQVVTGTSSVCYIIAWIWINNIILKTTGSLFF